MPKRLTTKEFIDKAKIIHKSTYDYSETIYTGSNNKLYIICPKHGKFHQKANSHLNGQGCPKCGGTYRWTTTEWIKEANNIHKGFYSYENIKYKNSKSKIFITCPNHGDFLQEPRHHLIGCGCPNCKYDSQLLSTKEFIDKAKTIHRNKYDYSKTNYKNCKTHIKIICHKHGIFLQKPTHHLLGCGCPKCKSSNGEFKIIKYLESMNIEYQYEKTYNNCIDKIPLPFDFYIPSKNLLIEYDGRQHFEPIDYFGGQSGYSIRIKHDIIKNNFTKKEGISLLRIPYWDYNNIENILSKALTE